MAIPTPRSYAAILSDMLDSFLARIGLKKLKIAGPLLSLLEVSAQSRARGSQDIFNMLNNQSIDRADRDALRNIAKDENLKEITASPASGLVNFLDTSFTKLSSTVYQGAAGPNAGTTALKVTDASAFPSAGSVYVGRGTVNYEGPLTYSSLTNVGPYWTVNLASGTTKYHNIGESVVVAQGGVRTISSGTVVQTPQGSLADAVKFTTLYANQIEDGETSVSNVEVIANQPGTVGNVPSGAIREVVGSPFPGASVTNPLPFTNGLATETDDSLRERIKAARQSRTKGTVLAITSGVKGVTSKEDNKTVVSASMINRQGETSTLYIDDGTGYEESTNGIAQEVLVDSALGGEYIFQLSSPRPIAKAFVTCLLSGPFALTSR